MDILTTPNVGYLELIMGPMFAGKTSRLIKIYNKMLETFDKNEILVINHSKDTRYDSKNKGLCSHDQNNIPCTWTQTLFDLANIKKDASGIIFANAKIILINECQFFSDIVEWVKLAVEVHKKKVFLCGLDCDFKRDKFGDWLDLIVYADNIIKLKATCNNCGCKNALYSHRLTDCKDQILIGNAEHEPLCRNCFISKYNGLIK